MTGTVLGYESSTDEGVISANDGQRYKFSKENWKDKTQAKSNLTVDFEITENNIAKDIYVTKNETADNKTIFGLIAVAITFFFGFVGTFVSRLFLAKQSIGSSIVPTIIHLLICLLVLIPILGWIIYLVGTGYFMYKNYKIIVDSE